MCIVIAFSPHGIAMPKGLGLYFTAVVFSFVLLSSSFFSFFLSFFLSFFFLFFDA